MAYRCALAFFPPSFYYSVIYPPCVVSLKKEKRWLLLQSDPRDAFWRDLTKSAIAIFLKARIFLDYRNSFLPLGFLHFYYSFILFPFIFFRGNWVGAALSVSCIALEGLEDKTK